MELAQKRSLYSVKPKAKRFQITGWCAYCLLDVKITSDNKCMICSAKVKRKPTNEKIIHQFEKLIVKYREVLDAWVPTTPEVEQPLIKMKMGFFTYFISIRYFQEFENLNYSDDEYPYDPFLEHIKKTCPRIAF